MEGWAITLCIQMKMGLFSKEAHVTFWAAHSFQVLLHPLTRPEKCDKIGKNKVRLQTAKAQADGENPEQWIGGRP